MIVHARLFLQIMRLNRFGPAASNMTTVFYNRRAGDSYRRIEQYFLAILINLKLSFD